MLFFSYLFNLLWLKAIEILIQYVFLFFLFFLILFHKMELAEVEAEYTSALQPLRLSRVYLDQSSESKDNEYSTLKRTALEV